MYLRELPCDPLTQTLGDGAEKSEPQVVHKSWMAVSELSASCLGGRLVATEKGNVDGWLLGEMVLLAGSNNERFEPVIVTHLHLEITLP